MTVGITIAIDAMSGDEGPEIVVPAAFAFLNRQASKQNKQGQQSALENKAFNIILVGKQDELRALLLRYSSGNSSDNSSDKSSGQSLKSFDKSSITIVHADTVVAMEDRPSHVLRKKQNSSMAIALGLVRDGKADACVSAGNTGALMILGRSTLGMYPGIDRPAITKLFPSQGGGCFVLDLGANVDSSAEHLLQFAIMGQLLAQTIKGIEKAKVALLNVGGESIKGNEQVRLAASLIGENKVINYVGFAEGSDIFSSLADVIVCDGFVGNVALKSAEGAAKSLLGSIQEFFSANWYRKILGFLILPMLQKQLKQLDPDAHNGAIFLGLQGVLVKSHGHADAISFEQAIDLAAREAEVGLPELINRQLEDLIF